MQRFRSWKHYFVLAALATVVLSGTFAFANSHERHATSAFSGVKVNGGTALHYREGNDGILELSPDFKIPDTPAPHWQVVSANGNVYLLKNLTRHSRNQTGYPL